MSLNEYQFKFSLMVAVLIFYAYLRGYRVSFGDAFRDPRVFGQQGKSKPYSYGSYYSAHKHRLAIDLNIFKDGKYLANTKDHLILGKFWESIGGTWGGRFEDGNHYSLEYKGIK